MIGLDTKVVVRYLAQDDPIQSPKATQIFERRLTEREPGFISLVTMVETVWVLDTVYGLPAQKIAQAVELMLQADTLHIQNEQEVFTAVAALKSGRGSFADALVGALGSWAGCGSTLTFDRRAARFVGFEIV
jgi:predicted nucleic-acid-binding protein